MAARNEGAPPGVADGFQLADKYMEMDTLLNLVSTGLTSTLLSCVLALVVLLLFTGDLVVALLAFACVGLTVCTVLGLMVMRDEPMGIVESVVLAILVGMAVDYVVHLGVAFVEADVALGPRGRTAEALGRMGQPILSGAGTTIITAASLFLPRMITFNTFGRFIVTIVGVSCVQAMVYFPMLLMHFGPRSRRCSFSIPRTMRLVLALSDRGTAKAAQHTPAVGGGAADSSRAEAAGEAASPSWWRGTRCTACVTVLLAVLLLVIYAASGVAAGASVEAKARAGDAPTCRAEGLLNLTFRPYEVPARKDSYGVCAGTTRRPLPPARRRRARPRASHPAARRPRASAAPCADRPVRACAHAPGGCLLYTSPSPRDS